MIVSSRTMKPQKVSACATPGTDHLQQLALPDHLGGLDLGVPARMLADRGDPLRGWLAGPGDPVQPPQPLPGQCERDHGEGQPDDDAHGHADLLGKCPVPAYAGAAWRPLPPART